MEYISFSALAVMCYDKKLLETSYNMNNTQYLLINCLFERFLKIPPNIPGNDVS